MIGNPPQNMRGMRRALHGQSREGGRDGGEVKRGFRFIRITASEATDATDANDNPVQWVYDAEEVEKTSAGYGGWTKKTGGWSGKAYNFLEDQNDGSGRQANMVDHDGSAYPSGFKMEPMLNNTPVPAILVPVQDGEDVVIEAWFMPVPNGEDGTC